MAVTFSDNFNRADSSTVGNGWVEVSGDFSISSNQLTSTLVDNSIITQDSTLPTYADYYVSATVYPLFGADSDGFEGIIARYTDSTHFYYLSWGRGSITSGLVLNVKNGASDTVIGSDYTDLVLNNTAVTIKLVVVGNIIQGYVNNHLLISVTNSTLTAAGKAGIRKGGISDSSFWTYFEFGDAYPNEFAKNSPLRPRIFSPGIAR